MRQRERKGMDLSNLNRVLRLAAVIELVGKSRSSVYSDMAAGLFPSPIRIGERAVAWREIDIREWLESRPAARISRPLPVVADAPSISPDLPPSPRS